MQDYVAHLQRLHAQKQALLDEKAAMMSKMAEEGRSLTEEELKIDASTQAQIETVERTIKAQTIFIDQIQAAATPVEQPKENMIQAKNYGHGVSLNAHTLAKGELAGQYIAAQVLHKIMGDKFGSSNVMETIHKFNAGVYPRQRFSQEVLNMFPKLNASYAQTTDQSYMGWLIDWGAKAFGEVIELAQQQSIAMPILRAVRQAQNRSTAMIKNANGTAGWVEEGAAKPVSEFSIAAQQIAQAKIAAIRVATMEMITEGAPEAARLITEDMTQAIAVTLDQAFFTAKAATTPPTPDGVFVRSTPVTPSSFTAPTLDDVKALIAAATANATGSKLISNFIVMMHTNFAFNFWADEQFISTLNKPVGFNMGANYDNSIMGSVAGIMPLVRSDYVTDDAGNPTIAVIDKGTLVASIGALDFDFSREATITDAGASATYNMFQQNMIAYRMEQFVGWLNGVSSNGGGAYMKMHTSLATQSAPVTTTKASKTTSSN